MRELLQRMIHYRKEHTGEASLDAQTVAGFETEYQEIPTKPKKNTNVMSQARITAKATTYIAGCRNIKQSIFFSCMT